MKVNARNDSGLVNPQSGRYLELDIYLPSLQLAFDFQVSYIKLNHPSILTLPFPQTSTHKRKFITIGTLNTHICLWKSIRPEMR